MTASPASTCGVPPTGAPRHPNACEANPTRRRVLVCAASGSGAVLLPALCIAQSLAQPGGKAKDKPSQAAGFYGNFRGTQLLDQDGRKFDPAALLGRTVLVNFVFTGCSTVCPVQTHALAQVQRQLPPAVRSQVRLLSVSLDPLGDTPQALKAFALRMGVDLSGWSFVTGRPNDIERVSDALRLFRPGPEVRRPDDHATGLWLIDRHGQLRLRYDGNPPDVKRLLREIPVLDELTRRAGA
jgi:protein SCO1